MKAKKKKKRENAHCIREVHVYPEDTNVLGMVENVAIGTDAVSVVTTYVVLILRR
jgi:hypothetical protein